MKTGIDPRAKAGWFGPAQRPRFGWLHQPQNSAAKRALVIVPPFGYEAVCAHRTLRHLAMDAAQAGLAALRFDLDGTGDSAGDSLDPDRLAAWLASIDDACDLARSSGASDIVLVGVRLGATLAVLAAGKRDDIAGLVAINPVIKGKAWLREARALQMALDLAPAPQADNDAMQELVGFAISAETRESLAAINLLSHDSRPAPALLLIERDDMPANAAWPEHLRSQGCQVDVQRLPGYAEMLLDPHMALPPTTIIAQTVSFAGACAPLTNPPSPRPASRLQARIEMPTAYGRMLNEVVQIDARLFGISSRPLEDEAPRTLVLLNAGGIARIGPNRLFVQLARRRVGAGERVLRVDLSGVGDSPAQLSGMAQRTFHAHTGEDVAAIIVWLRSVGVPHISIGGLCSGGYHALKAALAGDAVDTVLMINPLTFDFQPDKDPVFRLHQDSQRHASQLRSKAGWSKLLRGQVSLRRTLKVLFWRLWIRTKTAALNLARTLRLPLRKDLGCQLQALASQGIEVHYVFAREEPASSMLAALAGNVVPKLIRKGKSSIQIIDGPDHAFTPRWSHDVLLDALTRVLDRPH